ncbi:hypothetical protein [Wolbachia endosymbiont (group A) of Nomada goodeniana]|uniref:hypothetical protein n=1 Tax=Wolbachia endosymbiont (group A) of Nomada goodeniana TaxID=3066207 RepID=UPI003340E30D
MLQFKNIENRKNITYELACNEGKLTSKDKKILNLAKKIEKDADVVKELKKFDKIEEILMVEIVRKCEGRKERLTLLQQALLYSHNATLEYVIKRAEEYKLFEKISGKRIVSEHLSDHGEPISRTYSTVVCENGAVHRKTLTSRGKTSNNRTIIAEDKNNEKVPDLITINQGTAAVGILTETESCESSEGSKNFSKETAIEESRACDMQEDIGEAVDDYRNNFDFKEQKVTETGTQSYKAQNSSIERPNATDSSSLVVCFDGDATDKKDNPSTKTTQQRQAILAGFVGTVLLVSSVALCIMEMHVIAVVGGIVGLACIGFALYKPNTKLEKVEDPAQPVIVHSYLNTT